LVRELRTLITTARARVARHVNEELVTLYWSVGKRVRTHILRGRRARYGDQIVYALSGQLVAEFGDNFSTRNLWHMVRFAETFADEKIVNALRTQLSWTHFRRLIGIENPLARDFYAEMCRIERWNTRMLDKKIQSMLYERTALSRKPAHLVRAELDSLRVEDKLTPDLVFRDPYLLSFLGLKDRYLEKDLEDAIVRELEHVVLEFGVGFAFVARQKRISVDGDDHYLDLLFFHRGLRRLVAVEPKLGDFQPADKGQMELYLRWLEKHDMRPGEETPVGLILCAGTKRETVELLELEKSGIRVASYWLDEIPRKLLEQKLHDAIRLARSLVDAKEHG